MTKVIKEKFEKINDIKVEDDSLACDSPLEVFNCEVSRLSKMDDDLFTYEVEIANIPCGLRVDDDSEDDEVELTDEEFSNNEDEIAEVDPDLLTKDIMGFKTYDDYKDDWIYEWNNDVPWVDEKPWTNTGAIMEGSSKYDDDESSYEQMRRCDIYTNYDDTYKTNHDDNEREELCEVHEPPVCTIQRFKMIKYSFGQGEEYFAIKEDEYNDLARTSNNACRMYQEIFRMMDEGWMVTRDE
ncbi:hypothetical protein Tco_1474978 [Tanacetum coccineum]